MEIIQLIIIQSIIWVKL